MVVEFSVFVVVDMVKIKVMLHFVEPAIVIDWGVGKLRFGFNDDEDDDDDE